MLIVLGNVVSTAAVARSFSNYLRVVLNNILGAVSGGSWRIPDDT